MNGQRSKRLPGNGYGTSTSTYLYNTTHHLQLASLPQLPACRIRLGSNSRDDPFTSRKTIDSGFQQFLGLAWCVILFSCVLEFQLLESIMRTIQVSAALLLLSIPTISGLSYFQPSKSRNRNDVRKAQSIPRLTSMTLTRETQDNQGKQECSFVFSWFCNFNSSIPTS
jgi:hypothetical protein